MRVTISEDLEGSFVGTTNSRKDRGIVVNLSRWRLKSSRNEIDC